MYNGKMFRTCRGAQDGRRRNKEVKTKHLLLHYFCFVYPINGPLSTHTQQIFLLKIYNDEDNHHHNDQQEHYRMKLFLAGKHQKKG